MCKLNGYGKGGCLLPLKENSYITIGGVRFKESDIFSYKTNNKLVKECRTNRFNQKSCFFKSENIYFVELKQGTKLKFPKQDVFNNPNVNISGNDLSFEAINGMDIKDTKEAEKFDFKGCNDIYLNSNNGGEPDRVISRGLILKNGKYLPNGYNKGDFDALDAVNNIYMTVDFRKRF